jgi:hypothetical protein
MWQAEAKSVRPRSEGEDDGNVAFVKPISSSRQFASVMQCGALHFVFDSSSIRPRSRFGCFLADCAFPHGISRDAANERAFCYGTCRDVELGRPLIDIWRASPCLPAFCS